MPTNNPPEVNALMKVLALGDGSRRVASPLKKRANDADYDPMPTVHSLLLSYYDLKKVRAELVAALVPYVKDNEQKKRITALLQAGVSRSLLSLSLYLYTFHLLNGCCVLCVDWV